MHPELAEALTVAARSNADVNDLLVAHLSTPEMLDARTPGDGFTVAEQLAHFLSKLSVGAAEGLPELYDPERQLAERDPARIRAVLDQTSAAVLESVVTAPDRGQLPHVSLAQFLIHMLVHDAHHRGQILLALKANGLPLPDEAAMWFSWNDETWPPQ
jgi:DinB family